MKVKKRIRKIIKININYYKKRTIFLYNYLNKHSKEKTIKLSHLKTKK